MRDFMENYCGKYPSEWPKKEPEGVFIKGEVEALPARPVYDVEEVFGDHLDLPGQFQMRAVIRQKAKELASLIQQVTPMRREQFEALSHVEHAVYCAIAAIERSGHVVGCAEQAASIPTFEHRVIRAIADNPDIVALALNQALGMRTPASDMVKRRLGC
jgi:hypothetical protein